MARLKGTGVDPLGRYGKGDVFDVPADDPQYQQLIDNGFAVPVPPQEDPARTGIQLADAVVSQGGTAQITDPVDRQMAKEVAGRAADVVHTENPDAQSGDAGLDPDGDRDQDERQVSASQVTASSLASANPEAAARLQEQADAEAKAAAEASYSGDGDGDGEGEGEQLTGKALDARAAELDIEGRSEMTADEKRKAIAKAEAEAEAEQEQG